jgi:serine/threonine protein kinase
LKQLTEQCTWKDFLSEVYVWKLFNSKGEDKLHMSPLLCTFERTDDDGKIQYSLLFPWASGDLRHFWANNSSADDRFTLCWMAEQCWRLAEALSVIHQDQEENDPTKPGDNYERLYGRHGDIKPGNILWFAEHVGCQNAGTLVLADFGIAKCHRLLTKSMSNPATAKYSPTYRSPEFNVSGHKIGRKSDIWGLACTYIEFVTWYLKDGQAGNDEFADFRDETDPVNENFSQDTYFSVTNEGAIVKPRVVEWMRSLHEDDRCSRFLHDFLFFIETRMLVVNPSERATAHDVSEELKVLYEKSTSDSTYANSPSSWCPASSQGGPL